MIINRDILEQHGVSRTHANSMVQKAVRDNDIRSFEKMATSGTGRIRSIMHFDLAQLIESQEKQISKVVKLYRKGTTDRVKTLKRIQRELKKKEKSDSEERRDYDEYPSRKLLDDRDKEKK